MRARYLVFAVTSFAAACSESEAPPAQDGGLAGFPVVDRFEVTPSTVPPGGRATLSYQVRFAEQVDLEPGLLQGSTALAGQVETPPLSASTSFELVARSAGGETRRRVRVTVGTGDVQIVRFEADPAVIAPGMATQLFWETQAAESVAIATDSGAVVLADGEPTGSLEVQPNSSTVYVLTARGSGGEKQAQATVLVGTAPRIVSFVADPAQITRGSSTLSWVVEGASGLELRDATGIVAMALPSQGSRVVMPSQTTAYQLVASNDVGSAVAMASVTVLPPGSPRIVTFRAEPESLPGPGAVNLIWSTEDATAVRLLADGAPVPEFPETPMGMLVLQLSASTRFELVAENGTGQSRGDLMVVVGTPDRTPPTIRHQAVTNSPEGTSFEVAATVSDADSTVGAVALFYRRQGESAFQSVQMVAQRAEFYVANVPASAVLPPGVEYYVQAADTAGNTAVDPAGAPANLYAVSVVARDTEAPVINHVPVGNDRPEGLGVEVVATVSDRSGVASVVLYYKRQTESLYASLNMVPGASDYRATIPVAAVVPPGVDYYLEATDGQLPANVGRLPAGAPVSAHQFTVLARDATGPTILHDVPADGQPAGSAVTITAELSDATGIGDAQLYYRVQGASTFTGVAMTGAGNVRSVTVPGASIAAPAMEYYIQATDTVQPVNQSRSPAMAPGVLHRFTVTVVDAAPPTITHVRISDGQAVGVARNVTCTVTDGTGVASVTLYYRARGATTFDSVAMTGGPSYSATIPVASVTAAGVEYYFRAVDTTAAANAATLPSNAPSSVYFFATGTLESETNNTTATADALLGPGSLSNIGLGAISQSSDGDYWIVQVPTTGRHSLRAEVTVGGPGLCINGADSRLRLYDTDGFTILVSDDADGVLECSLIDPATDTGARALAPGRYYLHIEEDGRNGTIPSYELRAILSPVACGNGILETAANELCDDGNMVNGDGCTSTCLLEPQGTFMGTGGVLTGAITPAGDLDLFAVVVAQGQFLTAEVSDGMGGCNGDSLLQLYGPDGTTLLGSDDDDGPGSCSEISAVRDTFARNLAAGTYFLRVSGYGSAVLNSYSLRVALSFNICGNNQVETGEVCDDGNTVSNDGCSSVCQWETAGTVMGLSSSFTDSISPMGNIDWFRVDVPAGYALTAETFSSASGDCVLTDTIIRLWAADRRTQIVSDDDDGPVNCSALGPLLDPAVRGLAAGTYYLSVEDFGNNSTINSYVFNVNLLAPSCGDGYPSGAETCDDGNTVGGDGCSATCAFENVAEVEPNETVATATPFIESGATSATILGVLDRSGDRDVYRIVVPQGYHVFAEVVGTDGGCPVDSDLRLLNSSGSERTYDSANGPEGCGRISPGFNASARGLTAGTYYLEVRSALVSNQTYVLNARVLAPGCGDLYWVSGETCDDGNTVSGDGCSATCQTELAELEPNATSSAAQALMGPGMIRGRVDAGDQDWYAITVPAGARLGAFTHRGAIDQCETNLQSIVEVHGASGLLATDTADGAGTCSAVYRSEAGVLTAGTHWIRVRGVNASISFDYVLSIELQQPGAP